MHLIQCTAPGILLRKQNGYFSSWIMSIVESIQTGRVCYDFISHLLWDGLKTDRTRQYGKKNIKKEEIINDPEHKSVPL